MIQIPKAMKLRTIHQRAGQQIIAQSAIDDQLDHGSGLSWAGICLQYSIASEGDCLVLLSLLEVWFGMGSDDINWMSGKCDPW